MGRALNSHGRWLIPFNILFGVFIVFNNTPASADIWKGHIVPTLEKGFDQQGLLIAGAGLSATIVSQPFDDDARGEWGNNRQISKGFSKVGDILGTGVPGIAIAVTQLFVDEEHGWAHAESLAWAFTATSILKQVNQRQRPNGLNRHSMPSGHTSTAFATATSLSYAYGWQVGIPSLALATFVGLTRMSDDAHWMSDTIAGAAIGIFWGRAASFHHNETTSARLEPWILEDGYGLKLVKGF